MRRQEREEAEPPERKGKGGVHVEGSRRDAKLPIWSVTWVRMPLPACTRAERGDCAREGGGMMTQGAGELEHCGRCGEAEGTRGAQLLSVLRLVWIPAIAAPTAHGC